MDPITHAASGAVAMLALPDRPLTRWAVPLGALAAASPDVDVFFASGPLQFLLLHRGITHALAAVPFMGLLLALCAWPLWRKDTPGHWRFGKVWLLTSALVLLHIWLDVVTTYGTMIFLPFSTYRVRLNAIFIVDFLLLLPLLWALWRWRARRGLMLLALAWVFVYPALAVGLNNLHSASLASRLHAEGRRVHDLTVLPDALAPFFWHAIFSENADAGAPNAGALAARPENRPADRPAELPGPMAAAAGHELVRQVGLDALGRPRTSEESSPALPAARAASLARASTACAAFLEFSLLPIVQPLSATDRPGADATARAGQDSGAKGVLVHDLRFGSNLLFVRRLAALWPHAGVPFQLLLWIRPDDTAADKPGQGDELDGTLVLERLRFSGSGRDSGWQRPRPPQKPSFWPWLVGLR